MHYYYLDGLDKKGPYSVQELSARNLTPDTLVITEGMSNWATIRSLPDLSHQIFGSTDSEIPAPHKSALDANTEKQPDPKNSEIIRTDKKITIPSILFLIIGILAAIGCSYLFLQSQRKDDMATMEKKIDQVFLGKDEVCDHTKSGVQGKLRTADAFTPEDNEGKELVEYYQCETGGFTVLSLTKKPNGFDLVESYSKNMGYKVPGSRWTPGRDYGYGLTTPGYSTSTYRQSVQVAYNEAMAYLSSEKENKCYSPGSFDRIKTFDEISTDYYFVDNVEPSKYSSASLSFKNWKSVGDASVFNSQWIVWYGYDGKHYEIIEDKKVFLKRMVLFSSAGSLLALLIYLMIRYRRRIALQIK